MATKQRNTQWKLVQDDGGYEREVYEADDLNQMAEFIKAKGGTRDEPP